MKVICDYCNKSESFRKSDDLRIIEGQGWSAFGFCIHENRYYFICKDCKKKKNK